MSIRKDFHEQSLATRHQFPILLATPVVCESFSRAHFGAAEAFRLAKYGLFPPRIELGARIRRIRRVTTVPRRYPSEVPRIDANFFSYLRKLS